MYYIMCNSIVSFKYVVLITMSDKIFPKKIKGKIYYYYQYTYREKVDPKDHYKGKGPGSGKSRVRTHSEYLGTARFIRDKIKQSKGQPLAVKHLNFGVLAATYQTAIKIGLLDTLKKYITGQRFGIPRWFFFFIAILNRIDNATSKEKMGTWAAGTILPRLLGFDPNVLNSKTFWYVTDDIISESELRKRRRNNTCLADDVFVGLNDQVFRDIEKDVFTHVRDNFAIEPASVVYDTTNFFTYIQPLTPCELAETGHNKDSHHHLKQVGLAVAVEQIYGLPFFHRTYRGNSHDSTTFFSVIDDLVQEVKQHVHENSTVILVMDKGNNSEDNFNKLKGKLDWIGSLVPSHYPDLLVKPPDTYEGEWDGMKYFRVKQKVIGIDCVLVMTFNPKLYKKQMYSLENGIEKIQKHIRQKLSTYKRLPGNSVPQGIESMRKKSRYGCFFEIVIKDHMISFPQKKNKIEEAKIRFGKNLIFTNRLKAESPWIIDQYKNKNIVEQDFNLLKDPELVRNRPIRHWTDTKIRSFCFSCVMALLLLRVMQLIAKKADLDMSPLVLKQELQDLKLISWLEESLQIESKVSERSTVQQKLWDIFRLKEIENELTIH